MAAEEARRRKFAELVPNHILCDIHRHMPAPIVDGDRMADHLGEDRGRARPSAQYALLIGAVHVFDPAKQLGIDVWAFFRRTRHIVPFLCYGSRGRSSISTDPPARLAARSLFQFWICDFGVRIERYQSEIQNPKSKIMLW